MAPPPYEYDNYIVSFPAEYVAHVKINRPEKLNSFKESYVCSVLCFHCIYIALT